MFRGLVSCLCMMLVAAGAFAQAAPPAVAMPPASSAAPAAAPVDPYAATVPVAGTSDAQRNAAIAAALTQVLQQVAPGYVPSADVLARAPGFVRDVRYRRAASGSGLEVQVEFDQGAVSRVVASAPSAAAPTAPGSSASPGSPTPPVPVGGSGTVWVDGIDSSRAFATLLQILRGDSTLHDVAPIGAEGDGVMLHLAWDQPLATVLAALTGPAGHLAIAPQPHPGADASLHWVP